MPMYDTNDMVELKNRKKRKKRLMRLTAFLIIAAGAAGAYYTSDMWLPKLRGLGRQYTTIVNDGKLAEGNFPIEINGGAQYQVSCSDDDVIVLSDAYIYFYNEDGGQLGKRQHAYTNAVMRAANGRALIYESGGYNFSVEDRTGLLYNKNEERLIWFARLSDEGYTAVVTSSEDYECEMTVYDRSGAVIYQRMCMERVNDISFTKDSKGCVISYISAENGSLVTSVQEVSFTESDEKWTSHGFETLGLDVYSFDGGAFLLGIDACGYVDGSGNISSFYRYDGELAGGASSGGRSVVIINSDDRRKYVMAMFDGAGEPYIINFDTPLKDVKVSGDLAYVMTQDSVLAYDFSGTLRSTAQINDSYIGFERSDNYVFLESFSKIDRINYES